MSKMMPEIEAVIAALVAKFEASTKPVSVLCLTAEGDGSAGSHFKLRTDIGDSKLEFFNFYSTRKGWVRAEKTPYGKGRYAEYTSRISPGNEFIESGGSTFRLRNPQHNSIELLACLPVCTYPAIADAFAGEVRPHLSIWTDCADLRNFKAEAA